MRHSRMAGKICQSKLSKELAKLRRDPLPGVVVQPNENNIREWHFCLLGHKESAYRGGAAPGGPIGAPTEFSLKIKTKYSAHLGS